MLKIRNLTKRYGRHTALDSLDLQIDRGEIFGFVGPNGAGKTTTMKIMAGLLKADAGEIYIDDIKLFEDYNRLKEVIGYMPDFFGVYDNLQVMEYLEFYASAYGMETRQARRLGGHLLEMVHLEGKEECYVDELSRGMKQRLCLARALIHDPQFLILDEPASGLDPRSRFEFKEILKELRDNGKTIIISSHILMELAEMCTSIGIIERGKMILQGSIEDILETVDTSNPLIIRVYDQVDTAVLLLKREEKIESLTIRGNSIFASFSGNREEEARLLKTLIDNGVLVQSFSREQGSLESLFLKITEHSEEAG
ncbi:ABC transporter ATP-binding protein [Oscillospiraceae bacterium Marseille-Q3528]|nr:ABC transporter ATP-binding protein [Oscillospiraceae bacterium Marseille-Q3528]